MALRYLVLVGSEDGYMWVRKRRNGATWYEPCRKGLAHRFKTRAAAEAECADIRSNNPRPGDGREWFQGYFPRIVVRGRSS